MKAWAEALHAVERGIHLAFAIGHTLLDAIALDTEREWEERQERIRKLEVGAEVDIREVVGRLRYKPGWTFELAPPRPPWIAARPDLLGEITIRGPVVEGADQTEQLTAWRSKNIAYVPVGATEADVVRLARECVHRLEEHEADEWLRYGEATIAEPHTGIWRAEDMRQGWMPERQRPVAL